MSEPTTPDALDGLWRELTARVDASLQVRSEGDRDRDARRWARFEQGLLEDQQRELQEIALRIARMETMTRLISKSAEARLDGAYGRWARHFDERLEAMVEQRVGVAIEHGVEAHVQARAGEIRNQVVEALQADVDLQIRAALQEQLLRLRTELRLDISEAVTASIDTHLEPRLAALRARVVAELTADIEAALKVRVRAALEGVSVELDVSGLERELTLVLQQVSAVEARLVLRLQDGDEQLDAWIRRQLVAIKGCLSDREALVGVLTEFNLELRRRLDRAVCVQPGAWSEPDAGSEPVEGGGLRCDRLRLLPGSGRPGETLRVLGLPGTLTSADVLLVVPDGLRIQPEGLEGGELVFRLPEGAQSGTLVVLTASGERCELRLEVLR
ncbi:MAG: hypothetical protein H6741_31830 [Alphaproteobacteria bacterium]|nr:hypothetical protein [Alphaproteobacteria bacterium]